MGETFNEGINERELDDGRMTEGDVYYNMTTGLPKSLRYGLQQIISVNTLLRVGEGRGGRGREANVGSRREKWKETMKGMEEGRETM